MTSPIIKLDGVSKRFCETAAPALRELSLDLSSSQIVGIVGPDGAGKTTLMRLLAGLLLPSSGTISVSGCDTVKDPDGLHELIGYMPQQFGLYEELTVSENLTLYADLRGLPKEQRGETFSKLLSFTGLERFSDRRAGNLSGGMKQKLGLACAMVKTPKVLLLDEPSVGVDPLSRRELWGIVNNLMDKGLTVIWSTSYLDEAEKCQNVILLNEGKVLYHGPPQMLADKVEGRVSLIKTEPEYKRKLLLDMLHDPEIIDGTIQGSAVRIVERSAKTKLQLPENIKEHVTAEKVTPRFEDAFIDLLGGIPKDFSTLHMQTAAKSNGNFMVEARNLVKKFGSFTAAEHISFALPRGEVFGLLGPNGAGKSTTFKMLCGLLTPTSGEALVCGYHLSKAPSKARSRIGYMAQKFSLYGNLSAKQNLDFFSRLYGLPPRKRRQRVEEMVETFGLAPFLDQEAQILPLGFKQRLALSCAVMHEPEVLFLDEPTSGVDPLTRREFWMHINSLVQQGVTILVTTHFMEEAEYCDRAALVYRGHIIALDSPDALKASAASEKMPCPTMEEAFIELILRTEHKRDSAQSPS